MNNAIHEFKYWAVEISIEPWVRTSGNFVVNSKSEFTTADFFCWEMLGINCSTWALVGSLHARIAFGHYRWFISNRNSSSKIFRDYSQRCVLALVPVMLERVPRWKNCSSRKRSGHGREGCLWATVKSRAKTASALGDISYCHDIKISAIGSGFVIGEIVWKETPEFRSGSRFNSDGLFAFKGWSDRKMF